ncbi:MAG TPA: 4-hydroxy-tetrahydrodipicolinate synthase, partial [Alphaproteobacteria bacterium]|nr:4-hydroxy-tetrahydrodipicolinate synthase [Alphaproteobacteria bacterium]
MFQGSITALITPFKDGKVDEKGFQSFVAWQIAEGIDGVVPCGTTGESPTLSHDEHKRVVELCVEVAKGKVPVIAGTGSNSTEEAIDLTQHAQRAGADAALIVLPYYNKPTPEGQYQHFKAIHDSTNLPIIIYNVPPRSAVDMSVDTMARLAKLPRIVGVKDATADLARPIRTKLAIDKEFCMLSGEDATALPFLAQGGVGCISVTSNVAPRLTAEM